MRLRGPARASLAWAVVCATCDSPPLGKGFAGVQAVFPGEPWRGLCLSSRDDPSLLHLCTRRTLTTEETLMPICCWARVTVLADQTRRVEAGIPVFVSLSHCCHYGFHLFVRGCLPHTTPNPTIHIQHTTPPHATTPHTTPHHTAHSIDIDIEIRSIQIG